MQNIRGCCPGSTLVALGLPCSGAGNSLDTDFPLGLSLVLWLTPSGFPWSWGEWNHWTMQFLILVALLPSILLLFLHPPQAHCRIIISNPVFSRVGDAAQWLNLGHDGKSKINVLWDSADLILHQGWRKWQLNQAEGSDKLHSPFFFCSWAGRRMWTLSVIFPFAFSLMV